MTFGARADLACSVFSRRGAERRGQRVVASRRQHPSRPPGGAGPLHGEPPRASLHLARAAPAPARRLARPRSGLLSPSRAPRPVAPRRPEHAVAAACVVAPPAGARGLRAAGQPPDARVSRRQRALLQPALALALAPGAAAPDEGAAVAAAPRRAGPAARGQLVRQRGGLWRARAPAGPLVALPGICAQTCPLYFALSLLATQASGRCLCRGREAPSVERVLAGQMLSLSLPW